MMLTAIVNGKPDVSKHAHSRGRAGGAPAPGLQTMTLSRIDVARTSGAHADIAEILAILTIVLAIEADATLRTALRQAAACPTGQALVLQLPKASGALEIGADDTLRPLRTCDETRAPHFETLVAGHAVLRARVPDACAESEQVARALLTGFLMPGSLPSRAAFETVFHWSPLIDRAAYRFVAQACATLDEWRSAARAEVASGVSAPDSVIAYYFALSHTMGHLCMLSSEPGAVEWLAGMANSFEWTNWTPSFALLRERTLWLAAAGAKSAAAFGPGVVDRYLRIATDTHHAYKLFDALFGLAAVALTHDQALTPITKAIAVAQETSARRITAGAEQAPLMFRSALGLLRRWTDNRSADPVALQQLGWDLEVSAGLATRQAFRLDPSEIDARGQVLGFAALPAIMQAPPGGHYPRRSPRQSPVLPLRRELAGLFTRAWGPDPKVLQTLH